MANVRKRISELTALNSASLDTTLVGVDNGTTYKIELDTLADAVTARVNILDRNRLSSLENATSSFEAKGRNIVSGSSQLTSSYDTRYVVSGSITQTTWDNIANKPAGIVSQSTDLSLLNQFTSSQSSLNTAFTNGVSARLQTSSFNDYTASQSTSSLVNRLNAIESVSGSWITENETGSFLTSLSGAISSSSQLTSSLDTRYVASGSISVTPAGTISGSAQITTLGFVSGSYLTSLSGAISSSSQLTTAFPSKTTGAWSVPAGASTQSFTVEAGASYTMWVNGNIPNGIITWNATVTTSNTNVPVVGSQYGWYYTAGNALVLTAMPDQIIGTTNTLISSPTSYAPNTSNVFKFGITNNSGTTQTINYGYIKLS